MPGDLDERFKLLGTLGRGGMGLVLLVRDRRLERDVALKLLRFEDAHHAKLFAKEARLLAGLEHDNVVRLYEFGEVAGAGGAPRPYLVMEYVRGNSLAARLALGRPTLVEAARIAVDVLRGIEEAHRSDIVHRDLKPGNVFLEPSGRAKVADFGLAVLADARGEGTAGRLAGTPGYMSPEQARRAEVGPPTDVFAAGVILHEMLTGRRLFTGPSVEALLVAVQEARPPAPSRVNPAVPAALDDLVARALAREPADRPHAQALRRSLESWLERAAKSYRRDGGALPVHPYKLLEHYDAADAPIYFGREAETLELVELVEDSELRVITMFGPCGIGKSSLLRAGLVPALDAERFEPVVLRAGAQAAATVRAALATLAARLGLGEEGAPPLTPQDLEAEPHRIDALLLRLERSTGRALVLVLDQAEEVFTLNPTGSPRVSQLFALVEALALGPAARTRVVISFRTEFRGAFYPLEERLGARHRASAVREIGRAGLVEAVEGPSLNETYRFVFERGLPDRIAGDVARTAAETGDAAPPLLQIVCRQLHDHMRAQLQRVITPEMYRTTVGGARGALARYVEQRLASDDHQHGGALARQLLKALTVKEDGGERHARARDEDELLAFPDRDAARHALERLISDHLVLREAGPDGGHRVRLVSEVVCPLVDAWQLEPDDAERAARALERAYARWRDNRKPSDELLAGPTLDLVVGQRPLLPGLTAAELAFLDASLAHRLRRRRRTGTAAALVAAVVGVSLWFAFLRPGEMFLDSDPPGAVVVEEGRSLGVTPLLLAARPGLHALQLSHPRHEAALVEVRVPAGGRVEHRPVLRYPYGLFSLTSDPPGVEATIYRQGATEGALSVIPVARTPFTTEVPTGRYRLELRLPGHEPVDVDPLVIQSNRRMIHLAPRLARITGKLMMHAPFAGARATLTARATGERLGPFALPLPPRELPAGAWRIEASGPTSLSDSRDVTVTRGQTSEVTLWTPFARALWEHKIKGEVFAAPALADLDGDGTLDVALAEDVQLRALSGRDGEPLWSFAAGDAIWSSPALADLDADGTLDLVFGSNDDHVHALSGKTGVPLWKHDAGADVASSPCVVPTTGGPPLVVVGSDGGTIAALAGADGAVRWQVRTGARVRSSPALADLDDDGNLELVVGSADGHLRALDAFTGAERWSHAVGAEVNSSPAVADLDGDGKPEVVVGAKDRRVRAVSGAGRLLWTADTGGEVRASPAVADLDGDGDVEVVAASLDHKLYVLDGSTGRLAWARDLGGPLVASPVLHDVDGDGLPEVVIGARDGTLHALSGRDGSSVLALQRSGPIAAPVALGDLDRDGARDLVFASWYDRVFALRGRTARPLWTARVTPPETPSPGDLTTVDLDRDGVADAVIGNPAGQLRAVSGVSGRELWRAAAGGAVRGAPAIGDVDSSGTLDVVVALAEGGVAAFAAGDGAPLWRARTGKQFRGVPLLVDVKRHAQMDVAIGDMTGVVRLLDGRSGHELWQRRGPGPVAHPMALTKLDHGGPQVLVVAHGGGRIEALDPASGKPVWSVRLPADALAAPVSGDVDNDGRLDLVVATGDGQVRVMSARDGAARWSFPVPGGAALAPRLVPAGHGYPAVLVVATGKGQLRAHSFRREQPLWDVALGSEITALGQARLDRQQAEELLVVTEDASLRVLRSLGGSLLTSIDLTSATAVPPQVLALGPERRACLLAVHAGSTLVATPLPGRLLAPHEPMVFSFTSGSGRWADTRPGR